MERCGVIALVCVLTWLSTAGATLLPPIILDQRRISPIVVYPISFAILISLAALLLLLRRRRRRSLLDVWLAVVALAAILELAFSGLIPTVRFSAGFYAGRAFHCSPRASFWSSCWRRSRASTRGSRARTPCCAVSSTTK